MDGRRFFAPNQPLNTSVDDAFNAGLNDDGALDAYAEIIVWRLRGVHAMVSLIDRGTQYFLAGAMRIGSQDDYDNLDVSTTSEWFGCATVPMPGGLCEHTLQVDVNRDEYPCFIVNDLTKDERFASLPVVDGSIASYRFYAGAPIVSNGVSIGSIFFFDDKLRDGLSLPQKKFMHQQASNVMRHLVTKREAAERRRITLMSKGISKFLEKTSKESRLSDVNSTPSDETLHVADDQDGEQRDPNEKFDSHSRDPEANEPARESVLDKIRVTLDHAADILHESLELVVGGVVFFDAAVGHISTGNFQAYNDTTTELGAHVQEIKREEKPRQKSTVGPRPTLSPNDYEAGRKISEESTQSLSEIHKSAKVLAKSTSESATFESNSLDRKFLQSFINSYPQGNVWYTDEEGYFSSLEQLNETEGSGGSSPLGFRRRSAADLIKKRAEANLLAGIFHRARQIIFLPLWDAGGDRWYSALFVWSQSATPVFTVDSEVAYLSSFTNSVMVEISRLDAITSNKMKSDFISSISHEFRSPLHGILASAEFLRDSDLDNSQREFISTIQNCSGTLLDTINHVLDYSKINSFEQSGAQQDTIANELYQTTNLALLCEDVVNGMVAANEFHGATIDDFSHASSNGIMPSPRPSAQQTSSTSLDIILDIEHGDWDHRIQAGALRRVVMNIFGNAQKYTDSGYILVQLRATSAPSSDSSGSLGRFLSLRIKDSGRGMSTEYMERKLYHPFAQENSFAPGVGLGLSIVRSIVNQLRGNIAIVSELGRGTLVDISVPLENPTCDSSTENGTNIATSIHAEDVIRRFKAMAHGMTVQLSRQTSAPCQSKDLIWASITRFCKEWFGLMVVESTADLVITDKDDVSEFSEEQRILRVHKCLSCFNRDSNKNNSHLIGEICLPIGPFKLARSVLDLFEHASQYIAKGSKSQNANLADVATQTPLGSPEERTIMNGLILTDYFNSDRAPSDIILLMPKSYQDELTPTINTPSLTTEPQKKNNDTPKASTRDSSTSTGRNQSPSHKAVASSILQKVPASAFMNLRLPQPRKGADRYTKPLNILIVDDNALNLQLLQRYLSKRKGDTIVTARDGLEAVAAVQNAGSNREFDIIFMDISMPNMNGFEATRLIRKFEQESAIEEIAQDIGDIDFEKVPNKNRVENPDGHGVARRAFIVAFTGLGSRQARDEAEACGIDDFLTKPVSFGKVGELLAKFGDRSTAS